MLPTSPVFLPVTRLSHQIAISRLLRCHIAQTSSLVASLPVSALFARPRSRLHRLRNAASVALKTQRSMLAFFLRHILARTPGFSCNAVNCHDVLPASNMKLLVRFITIAASLVAISARAQIATFSFSGSVGTETTIAPNSQPSNAVVSSMSRGTGLTATSTGADTFVGVSWTTSASIDANDYFQFSITPSGGYSMNLTSLSLSERRSGTGIRTWEIRSSVDNYASALGTFSVPDDTNTRTGQSVTLSSGFSSLTTATTFRIYGYSAEAAGGTWRIDDVVLNGSISAIPEPSTYAAIFGALALVGTVWHRRRQRTAA